MIKMVAVPRRKPGMTRQEFFQYIEHVHGVLAREKPLGVVRYVQSHVFDAAFGAEGDVGYQVPFHRDAVTELFFPDVPAMIGTFTDPYVQRTVGPDGANFADLSEQIAQLMAEVEYPVAHPGQAPIKVMHFVKKADGVALEDFFSRWTEAHQAMIHGDPDFSASLRRCVQGRYIPEGDKVTAYFGPKVDAYEGCMSFWFDDEAALTGFRRYQRGLEQSSWNGPAFMDSGRSFFLYARENVIFDLA